MSNDQTRTSWRDLSWQTWPMLLLMAILPLQLPLALVLGESGFRWLVHLQVGLIWLAAVLAWTSRNIAFAMITVLAAFLLSAMYLGSSESVGTGGWLAAVVGSVVAMAGALRASRLNARDDIAAETASPR